MRIARLDLTRYGHFSDASLDFGPDRARDVTVVYGDNEAGKSTLFSAWLDLLYGIPKRLPPYAFLHERSQMQIGAALDTVRGWVEVVRTGTGLFDGAGHRLEESRLAGLLHNLDRDAYRMQFSLDDETLRQGGAEIARGRGDLGQALHVGTSGLAGIGAALDALAARADAFYRKGGSAQALPEAKRELKALTATLNDAELPPRRWDELQAAMTLADRRVEEIGAARRQAGAAFDLCVTALEVREISGRSDALRATLATLPDGADLPERAEAHVLAALATIADGQADRDGRLALRAPALAALEAEPEHQDAARLLAEVERIAALEMEDGTLLVERAATGGRDLANRRAALAQMAAERDARLAEAGAEGAEVLPLPVLDRVEAALADAEAAARDVAALRIRVERERAALPAEPPDAGDRAGLTAALDAVPDAAAVRDLAEAAREARALAGREAATLPDGWEALRGNLPEAEEVDAALAALRDAEAGQVAARPAHARAVGVRNQAAALRDAARDRPGAVGDGARDAARRARDRAWDRHLAKLDRATAEAFAEAMREDDVIAARHALGAEDRAALAAAEAALVRAEADLAARAGEMEAAQTGARAAAATGSAVAARLGAAKMAPDALRPRLLRLRAAVVAAEGAERAHVRAADAAASRKERVAEVARLLGETRQENIVEVARRRLDDLLLAEGRAKDRLDRLAEIRKIDAELSAAREREAAAGAALDRETGGTFLMGRDHASLRAAIGPLRRAANAAGLHADLADRIAKVTRATERLDAETAGLRDLVAETDGVAAMRAAQARAADLRAAAARRARAAAVVAETGADLARLDRRIADARASVARLLDGQGGSGDPRDRIAELVRRDRLRTDLSELEERNRALRSAVDAAMIEVEIKQADPARRDDLMQTKAALEEDWASAQQARGAARQAMDLAMAGQGGDAARQRRASLLEQLRDGAREAAVLRLGEAAARRALLRHQEASRGRMLEAAQAAFARLTDGAWTRLETGPGEKGEALFAVGHGARTRVDAMSTGTRGQVYLALRLAGHAGFAESSGPLPFVLDDVAETFDDTRARATLTMLGEIGERGQAILLTHHRHLVEMAREALPDVRVVDLPPRG